LQFFTDIIPLLPTTFSSVVIYSLSPILSCNTLSSLIRPTNIFFNSIPIIINTYLTHELDADDDASTGIFSSESRSSNESFACVVAVIAKNTDAIHACLNVLSQHPVRSLLVERAKDFSVPLVYLEVFRVKL
jgi:hypothetical protein